MHDLTTATREHALRAALHEAVADVEPCDCLDAIRARARAAVRPDLPLWLVAVAATVGLLLIVIGLVQMADPDESPPAPTTTVLEASR